MSQNFPQDGCATSLRRGPFLEHQQGRAFSQGKAIAAGRKWNWKAKHSVRLAQQIRALKSAPSLKTKLIGAAGEQRGVAAEANQVRGVAKGHESGSYAARD